MPTSLTLAGRRGRWACRPSAAAESDLPRDRPDMCSVHGLSELRTTLPTWLTCAPAGCAPVELSVRRPADARPGAHAAGGGGMAYYTSSVGHNSMENKLTEAEAPMSLGGHVVMN